MKEYLEMIYLDILTGAKPDVEAKVRQALVAGLPAGRILREGMIPAMDEVGRRFECGEAFIPEMLVAAKTMQAGLAILKPYLVDAGVKPAGRVVIGTVKGDLHDIGKNLVGMMLEGAGFEIIDLGTDVPAENFVAAVRMGVNILAMSSLLTTTMPEMGVTIQALEEAGLRSRVKIIVGGAPITDAYARQIGADGFAPDAGQTAALARSLLTT